jgi:hypothetical protein
MLKSWRAGRGTGFQPVRPTGILPDESTHSTQTLAGRMPARMAVLHALSMANPPELPAPALRLF